MGCALSKNRNRRFDSTQNKSKFNLGLTLRLNVPKKKHQKLSVIHEVPSIQEYSFS